MTPGIRLAGATPDDGVYGWTIPADVAPGDEVALISLVSGG